MSNDVFSSPGMISEGFSLGRGLRGRRGGRLGAPALRHVGEVALREVDRVLVRLREEVPAARDARVHLRAAHLLERHLLADDHLGHPRRAEVHRSVALAHDHDVAEGRDVGAAGRRRAEEHAHLGHPPRHAHLVVEDPARAAPAREHPHLLGDARAGRVHEVDHRNLERERPLLDPQDLLDRLRPPRARLHGRVVRHQRDLAPADERQARHDAVGAEPLLIPVREQRLLRERLGIDQARDPLAHGHLALLGGLLVVALGPAGERRV